MHTDPRPRPAAPRDGVSVAAWSAAGALVVLLLAIGSGHAILDDNEGLYGRVAAEMADGGSWIIPHLDGVPYLEKPPLLYWLTALSFRLFGQGEAASRAVPLLGALLVLSAIALHALRRWNARSALLSLLAAAASPMFVAMSHLLMFDLLLTGLLGWAFVAFDAARHSAKPAWWMRASYACLALAVLTKGLVAPALFGLVALGLALTASRIERTRLRRDLAEPGALCVFAAIALPWHLLAQAAQPRFAWLYFVNEHVLRFLGLREPHDFYEGPWWYYLPRLAAAGIPWVLVALLPGAAARQGRSSGRILWIWILAVVVFFSLSRAKANYYTIVALPAVALACGRGLLLLGERRGGALLPIAWMALLVAGAAARDLLPVPYVWPAQAAQLWAAALAVAAASAALFLLRRPTGGAIACAAVAVPLSLLLSDGLSANRALVSQKDVAEAIARGRFRNVYVFRDYENLSSLPFYLRRNVGIIDPESGDLRIGLQLEPDSARFPTTAQFLAQRRRGAIAVVALESRRHALESGPLGPGLHALFDSGRARVYEWRRPAAVPARGAGPRDGDFAADYRSVDSRSVFASLRSAAADSCVFESMRPEMASTWTSVIPLAPARAMSKDQINLPCSRSSSAPWTLPPGTAASAARVASAFPILACDSRLAGAACTASGTMTMPPRTAATAAARNCDNGFMASSFVCGSGMLPPPEGSLAILMRPLAPLIGCAA